MQLGTSRVDKLKFHQSTSFCICSYQTILKKCTWCLLWWNSNKSLAMKLYFTTREKDWMVSFGATRGPQCCQIRLLFRGYWSFACNIRRGFHYILMKLSSRSDEIVNCFNTLLPEQIGRHVQVRFLKKKKRFSFGSGNDFPIKRAQFIT